MIAELRLFFVYFGEKKNCVFLEIISELLNILWIFEMMAEIEKKSLIFDPHFEMIAELRLFFVYFGEKKKLFVPVY